MNEVKANDALRTIIAHNVGQLMESGGINEGDQCPMPDCKRPLKKKEVDYTDTSKEPWRIKEVKLWACECGFQLRRKE
jgi:hypothetical protein